MPKWFRPWREHAKWGGFGATVTVWSPDASPNAWGWTPDTFLTPWRALAFARKQVQVPGVERVVVYFHPHPWMVGLVFRVVTKHWGVQKNYKPPVWWESHRPH